MTVASQVKQTLANLRGVHTTLEALAAYEQNPESKQLLQDKAEQVKDIAATFEQRLATIEHEEPTFKGF